MIKKLNKKGTGDPLIMTGILFALTVYGGFKHNAGEWGRFGKDNLESRQRVLINQGVGINNLGRWYDATNPTATLRFQSKDKYGIVYQWEPRAGEEVRTVKKKRVNHTAGLLFQ